MISAHVPRNNDCASGSLWFVAIGAWRSGPWPLDAMPFELAIAWRYLLARRKQAFISLISLISTLGVAVGVTALIIALALMTGLQGELRDRILGSQPHIYVWKTGGITDYHAETAKLGALPGVTGAAPALLGKGLLRAEAGAGPRVHPVEGHRSRARGERDRSRPLDGQGEGGRPHLERPRQARRHPRRHGPRLAASTRAGRRCDVGDAGGDAVADGPHSAIAAPACGRRVQAGTVRAGFQLCVRLPRDGGANLQRGTARAHRAARRRSVSGAGDRESDPRAARTAVHHRRTGPT